jgi:NitT/TauT family transport system ATP-binding protein
MIDHAPLKRPPALQVSNLSHSFGSKKVLNNVSFKVKAGQIIALVGPSGCGKSTLLRAILGTHPPKSGQILADGEPMTGPTRHVGIVYQSYGLYDFLTVRKNVAFGPKLDGTKIPFRMFRPFAWNKIKKQNETAADDMLKRVGLEGSADCYPTELSGGMRQRVAIAQSLIMRPSILLLDEPFGALDEATREGLQAMLLNLYQENMQAKRDGKRPPHTILIVTHELNEALYVSDRLLGLSQYHADGKNGATIVYDKPTPVFRPHDPKDFHRFENQKQEIREAVFSPQANKDYSRYLHAWTEATEDSLPGDPNLSRDRI